MIQWRIHVHIDSRDTRGFLLLRYAKCILKKYLCGCPRAYIRGRVIHPFQREEGILPFPPPPFLRGRNSMPLERFGLKRKMIHRITIQDTIPDNIPFRLLRGNFITRDTLHASRKIAAGWNAGDRSGSGITLWGITINIPVCCTGWENTRSDFFQSVCIYIYIYAPIFVAKRTFFMERWQTIRGRNKNGTQRDRYRAC